MQVVWQARLEQSGGPHVTTGSPPPPVAPSIRSRVHGPPTVIAPPLLCEKGPSSPQRYALFPRHCSGKGMGGRWAICATGAGAHRGQTSREGEKDIWWMARTARGGTGHLGLTETQRGRLWTACGQRRVDSKNSQTTPAKTITTPNTPTIGRR